MSALPNWIEGKPSEPGFYIGFSTNSARPREKASLYTYDGKVWQHWSGFYDHAVTHYLPTDLPEPKASGEPA